MKDINMTEQQIKSMSKKKFMKFVKKKINDKTIECSATQVRIGGYKKDDR